MRCLPASALSLKRILGPMRRGSEMNVSSVVGVSSAAGASAAGASATGATSATVGASTSAAGSSSPADIATLCRSATVRRRAAGVVVGGGHTDDRLDVLVGEALDLIDPLMCRDARSWADIGRYGRQVRCWDEPIDRTLALSVHALAHGFDALLLKHNLVARDRPVHHERAKGVRHAKLPMEPETGRPAGRAGRRRKPEHDRWRVDKHDPSRERHPARGPVRRRPSTRRLLLLPPDLPF